MSEEKPQYQRIKFGGLWQNTTKTGITYMSGSFSPNVQIQIWPNKKRDGHNDPDFIMYFSEKQKVSNQSKEELFLPAKDGPDLADIPF